MTTRLATLVCALVLSAVPSLAQGIAAPEREAILRLAADRGLAADDGFGARNAVLEVLPPGAPR